VADERAPGFGPSATLAEFVAQSGRGDPGFWLDVHEAMSEGLVLVSPDRKLIYGNARARELLSVPLESALGRPCTDILDCPQCECRCRLFETGVIDNVEVTLYTPEPRVFRKNGKVLRDTEGNIIGGVETFADVTHEVRERDELKRRDEMLLSERRRRDALVENLSEGVITLDADLRVSDFSEQMVALTGFSAEQASGRSFFDLLGLAAPEASDPQALAGRKLELTITRRDGEPRAVSVSFLPLRFGSEELMGLVRPAVESRPEAEDIEREYGFHGMISRSPKMREMFQLLRSVADSDTSVLIQGESGSGKELVARAIHELSPRRQSPFFAVNCATFTGSLLLSELFGHERGAFTGAYRTQRGKLELAEGGTLLLDEVSEIPVQHQALLLRVLENRRFERLGGAESIPFSARVVAAANRSLDEAVGDGGFRSDLFFRLSVVPIRLPPLRDRPEDVELLLRYFMLKGARGGRPPPRGIAPAALEALEAYPWPGNIRELKNLVEYFCFLGTDEVALADLPPHFTKRCVVPTSASVPVAIAPADAVPPTAAPVAGAAPRAPTAETDERTRILEALEACRFQKAKAAERLGIDRTTLWRKMKKYGI
jgi:transcriptional regulator with PAS, ATPase and Fis domain